MLKKFLKSTTYIVALTILSIGGSILINSSLAAWTEPASAPPDGNVTNLVHTGDAPSFASITSIGSNFYAYQTANAKFYLDSYEGMQIRIDSDANDTSEFSINNGDNTEIFKIDETGLVTMINKITGLTTPTADSDAATKAYVDAAGGGGDATLAKQEEILTAVGSIGGDASYAKQLEIQNDLQRSMGWILPNQTYYSVGGNTYFCRQNAVNASGVVTISNINNGSICDASKQCSNGSCVSVVLLSYSGATHTDLQCDQAGGTIYNSGSGTICKFSSASCPGGWTQAGNWQSYSGNWGSYTEGDECGHWADIYPSSFSNQTATDYERTGDIREGRCLHGCVTDAGWQETAPYDCSDTGRDYVWYFWDMNITTNPITNRVEIGCK
ncbi:MAG: hypothetical protein ABIH48_03350 [Candidatus Falkowbacteria bacterium]